ncbi:MAG: hypothetical protein PHF46_03125, partial [Candidatus Gracilibacteria bacterium]|nr:hypothetical protein [Candidatus Gracilibacteria bacterium]
MKKYLKIYGIENLQNIFIHGFIYNDSLKETKQDDYYIIELNFKKNKDGKNLEYQNVLDINKVYFKNEKDLLNFETTVYSNLPIYKKLLEINELIFQKKKKIYTNIKTNSYNKKFENNYHKKISIDIKLGLLSSIYYYFTLNKTSVVNINGIFSILDIKEFKNNLENLSKFNLDIFENNKILKTAIADYKKNHQFNEIGLIFHILYLFLNGKDFEKRLFDDKEENYLSLFFKVISEVNKKQQNKDENYEYYINNILEKLDLDFYEKRYLNILKSKKIIDDNSLLEYLLIILIKGNFNIILNNPSPFQIKNELLEHVKLVCYILKGLFEGYKNLENEIKFIAYKGKVFDLILNKSSKKLEIRKDSIKYGNLIF